MKHAVLYAAFIMLAPLFFHCAGHKETVQTPDPELIGKYTRIPYNGPRKKVAVLEFANATRFGLRRLGDEISAVLVSELAKSGRFVLLEREKLAAILDQVALAQTGLTEGAFEQIRLLDTDYIITGKVTQYAVNTTGSKGIFTQSKTQRAEVAADVRLIDVRTGEILLSETGTGVSEKTYEKFLGIGESGGYDESLEQNAFRKAVVRLTEKLVDALDKYPWRCDIVQIEGSLMYINAGRQSNILPGFRLAIYRPGKIIRNVNGDIIGQEEAFVANAEVVKLIGEKSAEIRAETAEKLQLPLFCKFIR